jgi:hypothetical protein
MYELAKIVQQQSLENKKLEKLFSDSKRQALQLYVALIQKQESPLADRWDKFFTSEVTGSYCAVAREKRSGSFGIYVDVFLFLSIRWLDRFLNCVSLIRKLTST